MRRAFQVPEADGAAAWLTRLQAADCTQEERDAFERWRADDARHARAFAEVERIHRQAATLAADPLLAAAAGAASRRTQRRAARHSAVRRLAVPAAAAIVILAVGLHYATVDRETTSYYTTAVGEQRTFHLSDGTGLLLDTNSAVIVHYSDKRREVTLEHGRVQFDVVHASDRPFTVRAGNGVVRDIGTIFQVGDECGSTTVTLLKGKVSVSLPTLAWSTTLRPGQQVSYRSTGASAVRSADLSAARSWTLGYLVFKDRPLAGLVDEMNRYSRTKIRLGDESLRNVSVSGVFRAGDQHSLVQTLQAEWSLKATRTPSGEIVLRSPGSR